MKIDLNCFETKNHLYANNAVTAIAIKVTKKVGQDMKKQISKLI